MGNGARLSLIGMYLYNTDLFKDMALPAEWSATDKQTFINNLVMECGELEILYTDWDFLKFAIDAWSKKELFTWQRLYDASVLEYNPIENYNRTENTNIQNRGAFTHSGTDSVTGSGTDTDAVTGSDTDAESGYDSDVGSGKDTTENSKTSYENNSYAKHDKSEFTAGVTHTFNKNTTVTHTKNTSVSHTKGATDTTRYGHIITDTTGSQTTSNISGNIGVTTSQMMLLSEIDIAPKLNVMNYIIKSFRNRFCLLVY